LDHAIGCWEGDDTGGGTSGRSHVRDYSCGAAGLARGPAAAGTPAEACHGRAIDSGSSNIAPQAGYDLGCLLEEQGDIEGARAAYRRAIHHGPTGVRENAVRALLMLDDPLAGE
jgi:hypothetical protein